MKRASMTEALAAGRQAVEQHAWDEAVSAFTEADRDAALDPADLVLLAQAAWWTGRPDDSLDALERAHAGYERAGEHTAAAHAALELAKLAFDRGAFSVLQGWLARAERLLADEPESAAHARLAFWHIPITAFVERDTEGALAHANHTIELAQKHGDRNVETFARSIKGQLLIQMGRWREGLDLVDEAAAVATSGELDPRFACAVHCNTIACCRDLGDFRRAAEWTDQAIRWMRRQSVDGYVGICRVHRAELQRLRGSWPQAEQEARHASEELERFKLLFALGFAHYEVGEVRLHMGDLDAAEEAFLRAHEYGWGPHPGLALLLLARGEADEAASAIGGAVAGTDDPLARARLLPAQVEIALARDDLETANEATAAMEEIAEEHDSRAWEADALTCRGAVLLHEGDHEGAIERLNRAWRVRQEIELPYEAARARVLLGRAHAAKGDATAARMELRAARSAFERLGAAPDVQRVDELLGDDGPATTGRRQRVRRTFMFTDIVTSTDLVGVIGDAAWEELLRWHDRALRGAFARHRGEEVSHTGDGFFVAFDRAADAVECAVDIQRSLAEHRREHGFAPWVRIGIHADEATRDGADYRGQAVHAAARIGDLAEREEIVVTSAAFEDAGPIRFPVSGPRSVELKGIAGEVEVRTIDWR